MKWFVIMFFQLACLGCAAKQSSNLNSSTYVETQQQEKAEDVTADGGFEKMCGELPCRRNIRIKLKRSNGNPFEFSSDLFPPIVQDAFITIIPGESFFLEVEVEGYKLFNPKVVSKVTHPERTIKFQFWQDPGMADGTHMMLVVTNPFDKYLRYKLGMMSPDSEGLFETSSCPVKPNLKIFEHWPHPIFQLVVANIRLVDSDTDDLTCK